MSMKIEFITAHYYSYYSKTSILEYQLVSSNRIPKSRSPFWEKFMKNAPRNSFYIVLKPQFFWKFEKFFNKKRGKNSQQSAITQNGRFETVVVYGQAIGFAKG